MTQTVHNATQESTMHIPSAVLGIVLDTSNVSFKDAMKGLASAFLSLVGEPLGRSPHVTSFLIAASDGAAYPLVVTPDTFERQWKGVPWGKTPAIVAGLAAMHKMMEEYSNKNAPTPAFRTLLLTGNPPGEQTAFHTALSKLGRVEIAVLGDGAPQNAALSAYHDAIDPDTQATITRITDDNWQEWARTLFYNLN